MLALREHISKYQDPKEADKHVQELKIHMRHFEEAMKKIRPLSTQEINIKIYQNNLEGLNADQESKWNGLTCPLKFSVNPIWCKSSMNFLKVMFT